MVAGTHSHSEQDCGVECWAQLALKEVSKLLAVTQASESGQGLYQRNKPTI